jgi:hypothetical protein
MSADPNKKSARTFQCRDVLWETFEQMARELECSVDYLINEAMKQYARQRSYGGTRPPASGRSGDSQSGQSVPTQAAASSSSFPAPATGRSASGLLPPASRVPAPPGRHAPMPLPPPRGGGLPALPTPGARATPAAPPPPRTMPPAPPGRSVPPPLPRTSRAAVMAAAGSNGSLAQGALTLVYNGERHSISKDRFVIGRGKQSSDLTLKDPNVSRQHALIEFQNGVYFMVDMGSTNGVAYNGQRIARRQISEGDVFRICDHDLQFTFR